MIEEIANWSEKRGWKRIILDHITGIKEYLIRYGLWGNPKEEHKYFANYLHEIKMSDEDYKHNHPQAWVSIILRGVYREHTLYGSKVWRQGSFRFRSASSWHRLEALTPSIWTFFIAFPRQHKWMFLIDGMPVYWKIHLAQPPFDKNNAYWLNRWKELYANRSRQKLSNTKWSKSYCDE